MLEGLEPNENMRGCRVATVLAKLEGADRDIFMDAVNDTARWSSNGLSEALRARGIAISVTPIISHRKGLCKCSKI